MLQHGIRRPPHRSVPAYSQPLKAESKSIVSLIMQISLRGLDPRPGEVTGAQEMRREDNSLLSGSSGDGSEAGVRKGVGGVGGGGRQGRESGGTKIKVWMTVS